MSENRNFRLKICFVYNFNRLVIYNNSNNIIIVVCTNILLKSVPFPCHTVFTLWQWWQLQMKHNCNVSGNKCTSYNKGKLYRFDLSINPKSSPTAVRATNSRDCTVTVVNSPHHTTHAQDGSISAVLWTTNWWQPTNAKYNTEAGLHTKPANRTCRNYRGTFRQCLYTTKTTSCDSQIPTTCTNRHSSGCTYTTYPEVGKLASSSAICNSMLDLRVRVTFNLHNILFVTLISFR